MKKILKQMLNYIYLTLEHIYPKGGYYFTCYLYTHGKYICPNNLHIYTKTDYLPLKTYPTFFDKENKQYRKYVRTNKTLQNGILLERAGIDSYYNIVTIIQQGLAAYTFYENTQKEKYMQEFNNVCEWLINNQERKTGIWYYNNDYFHVPTETHILNPWGSCMAQGQALSLLARRYLLNKDYRCLEAMNLAWRSLKNPIIIGGLQREFNGYIFFEEYPTQVPSLTLNGFIFCLIGLSDYCSVLGNDNEVYQLLISGIETLKFILPYYDDKYCSTYDLSHLFNASGERAQNRKYHILHIKLLQCIYSVFPDPVFCKYIFKWSKSIGCEVIQ